jgi:DNA-binding CsgD family transcriptional regulator
VRGEAGVGKTALLAHVAKRASGCRILRVAGVESENELPYAALQQLCTMLVADLERLPEPQRDALTTAFGLSAGEPPDRFLVGLAVLNLLAEAAEDEPLVCLIDDAHWCDRASAQTLAFVARRLLAERVVMVFAVREASDERELVGLDELVVEGLSEYDSRALLDSVVVGPIDTWVRDRIVAETRGNPLALLELPRAWTPAELAFGAGRSVSMPLASRIEAGFRRRLEQAPAEARQLLLLAAIEPRGDAALLWQAAEELGIDASGAAAAEATGLVEIGAHVRFRHPLVRSAAYRSASNQARQAVHRALAEVTDPLRDPDRRAWHRAAAAVGPDEMIAGELERCADRAQARGGMAAAAAFLEESARLTADAARRAHRALAAARAKHLAGEHDAALSLLATAQAASSDELHAARTELLRAQIAFDSRHGSDTPPLLLEAARRLEPLDPGLARETYLDAFTAALLVGRLSGGTPLKDVAEAARRAPAASPHPRACDRLLDGLALLITDGRAAAVPTLKGALAAFRDDEVSVDERLRWQRLAGRVAQNLWDDVTWEELFRGYERVARQTGALRMLPVALRYGILVHVFRGELDDAAALISEVGVISDATGAEPVSYGSALLAAWRGREADARRHLGETLADVVRRGEGQGVTISHYTSAVLYNGLGRYEDARTAAELACDHEDLGLTGWSLAELIEAASRSGRPDTATAALGRLVEHVRGADSDWALGVEARCRALVSADGDAEEHYLEAISRLRCTRVRAELARAHLLYGEWLRRAGRRVDAREQLRSAHEMFSRFGADGFAERARRELLATGETVRKRSSETRDDLTTQEAEIARLAAEGQTNPEIAALLFLSPRTVEWHLRKVFVKLGIGSRKELASVLPEAAVPSARP